ncbi:toll/interleukin-1 receptor domain-containing protein [Variovorax sp. J31P179]|uniref:toll/interleukin-1 receptor domain-containing protein n=1 Tax=Variovorax sp. J31P179 TaxID=3053508 RepID=UPI0025791B30|nr:toll/interleukin-1 receptor domain-containing protein [Variovorax sp. J31P179]MDM0079234.1 toll/interleukin-1 receptor domain-containing protein [Variovorax sp. J31P179]
MSKPYHLFISYASEDEAYATELAGSLRFLGITSWFAPLSLKVGDKLLDSINAGLMASEYGLLLLSTSYLAKRRTSYELDVLHRQHIEDQKRLFPLWHGVEKSQISEWNPGLSGIIALRSTEGLASISEKIADIIYQGCPTRGISPSYENPQWRFLQGCGELYANKEDGGAFNLFEAAEFPDSYFPLYVHNRPRTKKEIILAVASALYYRNPDVIPLTKKMQGQMKKLCKSYGFDLDAPGFDPAIYG